MSTLTPSSMHADKQEKSSSPDTVAPASPRQTVRWRLMDGELPSSPSWMDGRARPLALPPPGGFHPTYPTSQDAAVPPRILAYAPTPSLPIFRQSARAQAPSDESYLEGFSLNPRTKSRRTSAPPSADKPRRQHRPTPLPRRLSTVSTLSFSSTISTSGSVILTPPAETISFAEPFSPGTAAFAKLSLAPPLELEPARPEYGQYSSTRQEYAQSHYSQQYQYPDYQYKRQQPLAASRPYKSHCGARSRR